MRKDLNLIKKLKGIEDHMIHQPDDIAHAFDLTYATICAEMGMTVEEADDELAKAESRELRRISGANDKIIIG